jgi:Protein kinase domain/NPCBM/NEW2 domain
MTQQAVASGLDLAEERRALGKDFRDIYDDVEDLLRQFRLTRHLLALHSLSICDESELAKAGKVVEEYRGLPKADRVKLPALLNAIGKLQFAAGDYLTAWEDFSSVAAMIETPLDKAEASWNSFHAALERRNREAALKAYLAAANHDPGRFELFPAKYLPQKVLGSGAFGVSFLCKVKDEDTVVVVKSLWDDNLERDVEYIFEETRALSQLDHPNLLRVYECSYVDPEKRARPYMVTEEFEGKSLEALIREEGTLQTRDVLNLAIRAAAGLHTAHLHKIVHRGVKPGNLLVRRNDEKWDVKVVDFGLVMKEPDTQLATVAFRSIVGASISGTVECAGPEQLGKLRSNTIGPASDIFGLAKSCCCALFQTPNATRRHWEAIPKVFAELLQHCLEKLPGDRPNSMKNVQDRLQRIERELLVSSRFVPGAGTLTAADRMKAMAQHRERVRAEYDQDDYEDEREERARRAEREEREREWEREEREREREREEEEEREREREEREWEREREERERDREREEREREREEREREEEEEREREERQREREEEEDRERDERQRCDSKRFHRGDDDRAAPDREEDEDDDEIDDAAPRRGKAAIYGGIGVLAALAIVLIIYFGFIDKKKEGGGTPTNNEQAKGKDPPNEVDPGPKKVEPGPDKKPPVKPPNKQPVVTPVKDFLALAGPNVYLSDVTIHSTRPGGWPVGTQGRFGNPSYLSVPANHDIRVEGRSATRGIGMHPNDGREGYTSIAFKISRRGSKLITSVALDDVVNRAFSPVTFEVFGDGQVLWQSPELTVARKVVPCEVDVGGVEILELRVSCTQSKHETQAVWVDPFVIKSPTETVRVEPKKQEDPLPPGTTYFFCSDLKESFVKNGTWPVSKRGQLGNPTNDAITVKGERCPNGISMHPNSRDYATIVFRLDGKGQRFLSRVGIDESSKRASGPGFFSVYGDDRLLWTSPDIRNVADTHLCDIDISGVNALELRTTARTLHTGLHLVWLDARVRAPKDTDFGKATPKVEPKKEDPRKDLRSPDDIFVFLTELKHSDVKNGESPVTKFGKTGIKPFGQEDSTPIIVKGERFPKGIGMQPANQGFASIQFKLDRKAKWFQSRVAIDDSGRSPRDDGYFSVHGDGRELWTSPALKQAGSIAECDINTEGVDVLELRTSAKGASRDLHLVWLDPRIRAAKDATFEKDPEQLAMEAPKGFVFLSDLKESDFKDGPWPIKKNGKTGNPNGEDIIVNGMKSPKGIGMHPPGSGAAGLLFNLDRKYDRFKGRVALNDKARGVFGPVVFEIFVDNKRVWQSRPIQQAEREQEFDIDVSKAKLLGIQTSTRQFADGLQAVWVDPMLKLKEEEMKDKEKEKEKDKKP